MKTFIIVIVTLVVLGVGFYFLYRYDQGTKEEEISEISNLEQTMSENFIVETLEEGEGDQITKVGDKLFMRYRGTLEDGTEFDSNLEGDPFDFTIGEGMVIQGWDQGLLDMKVGEKRKLTIPPEMGYGDIGAGDVVPPNATLIFEVELVSINE